jgi:hypothetical protein
MEIEWPMAGICEHDGEPSGSWTRNLLFLFSWLLFCLFLFVCVFVVYLTT